LRGKGVFSLLKAPFKIAAAVQQAITIFKTVKPHIVIGMGGYASGPGGVAAKLKRIPLVLHEQNALPGLTNRLLSKIANKVLTGFDKTFEQQRSNTDANDKYRWVGNPLRAQMQEKNLLDEKNSALRLLIVGGSLGAQVFNTEIPKVAKELEKNLWQVVHQTGRGNLATVYEAYKSAPDVESEVLEFIEDMPAKYQWADIVICRAGALTIAELALVGLPSILVPFPFAVDDHQTLNARALVDAGAAILLPQRELEDGKLIQLLNSFVDHPEKLVEMSTSAKRVAKPNATLDVADICQQIVGEAA
jgi:UDP-N-acetylglucosamine--N-acetylmuramyl-(pentapeptide) pyrophosphoryl-undecaprenol N-acetylglucosamine transferase